YSSGGTSSEKTIIQNKNTKRKRKYTKNSLDPKWSIKNVSTSALQNTNVNDVPNVQMVNQQRVMNTGVVQTNKTDTNKAVSTPKLPPRRSLRPRKPPDRLKF
ncbi:hypothetical protein BpHYR1_044064, partial [Brachionus plicatilis]